MSDFEPIFDVLDSFKGPGPEERKWRNRLRFKLTGHWGRKVVAERLRIDDLLGQALGLGGPSAMGRGGDGGTEDHPDGTTASGLACHASTNDVQRGAGGRLLNRPIPGLPRVERTGGWLMRWRVVYPTDGGMDLETLHATKLGARFAILMDRA